MTHHEELASLPLRERIARVLDASGLDQDEFGVRAGVTRFTVTRWINGKANPKRPSRYRLAEIAAGLYGEPVSPDLFREYVSDRPQPVEEALRDVRDTLADLAGLLTEQRELVGQMSRLVAQLEGLADQG